jgi:tetraprenyl-beta-curcumene synthase
VAAIASVYFPWICGVHILLDYLIDQEEDRIEGDLNFVGYYASRQAALGGMQRLVREAGRQVRRLPDAPFHQAVLEGLLGLYLTDAKVREQRLRTFAIRLLSAASPRAWTVFTYCSLWRRLYGRT